MCHKLINNLNDSLSFGAKYCLQVILEHMNVKESEHFIAAWDLGLMYVQSVKVQRENYIL